MILKYPFDEGGLLERPGVNTQYFGKDAEDFLESINWHSDIDYLGKECITDEGKRGIIVGFEDSESAMDYYFIVFIPKTGEVSYELANSPTFTKNIML